ncbi:1,4-alpha-glucan branching protein [Actinomyces vulturis]|uniref:1,4-alpha-glucan branching protein n=1 Tax=Actinomyces vulturis TaxID=1857645 RepID=UPI000AEF1FB9|nr:1,4-alpha-glucan branching protein [Actinomyces vulturis]
MADNSTGELPASVPWPEDDALCSVLLPWFTKRRWFPLKDTKHSDLTLRIAQCTELNAAVRDYVFLVSNASGSRRSLMHVPLCCMDEKSAKSVAERHGDHRREGIMVKVDGSWIIDGVFSPQFWRAWALSVFQRNMIVGSPAGLHALAARSSYPKVTTGEQSNTSVVFPAESVDEHTQAWAHEYIPTAGHHEKTGDLIVKIFRVLDAGRNPDVELPVALAKDGWDRVPQPFAYSTLELPVSFLDAEPTPSSASCTSRGVKTVTADSAVGCAFVQGARDGFTLMTTLAQSGDVQTACYLASDLGYVTADMHMHLAHALGTKAAPTFDDFTPRIWKRVQWAAEQAPVITSRIPALFEQLEELVEQVGDAKGLTSLSRIHGDYHLGQVLYGDDGWFVLDFEGEPLRPLNERTQPDIPAKDVAGMLRSFDYAYAVSGSTDEEWLVQVRDSFLSTYQHAMKTHGVTVSTELLAVLEIDKALYEVVYEARNRPDWIEIPLEGLQRALDVTRP